jgi:hypothetical protein
MRAGVGEHPTARSRDSRLWAPLTRFIPSRLVTPDLCPGCQQVP